MEIFKLTFEIMNSTQRTQSPRIPKGGIMKIFILNILIISFMTAPSFAQDFDTRRRFFEDLDRFPLVEEAKEIMSSQFYGTLAAFSPMGILIQRGELPEIPFKFRTLLQNRGCPLILTLPVFNRRANDVIEFSSRRSGKEPTNLQKLARGRFVNIVGGRWWEHHGFSEKPLNLSWRLVCFRRGFEHPFRLHERSLKPNERVAGANLAVYAMLINPTITGEYFTSDKNDQNLQVYVKRGKNHIIFPEHVFFNSQRLFGMVVEVLPDR
ncbi:hypothetical protein UR09_06280 [Candidatus Nitromaritima sp. SCGC AAA799-A02]|nr:hypothetical protein UR09_06280 [Candidatus Nitromaritima sp. SCGC AAA799-A02]